MSLIELPSQGDPTEYEARVAALLHELAVPEHLIRARALPLHLLADILEVVEMSADGREHRLVPQAAAAWRELRSAASDDGVTLSIVSAFRTLERQADIIRGKIACGLSLETIFSASAPPGYSEHHTGRAVDVTTPGGRALEVEFEQTAAFRWLNDRAAAFGFKLSFPRGNPHGFIYEPWHWCYVNPDAGESLEDIARR